MPFAQTGPDPLDAVVNIRLTFAERERLREEADLVGLSVSALVRRRYFGRRIVADTDLATIRELRRLGGLLKQTHTQSGGAYSDATANALADIGAAIGRLARPGDTR